MTSISSLKREVDILHKALIVHEKPKPEPVIDLADLTNSERQTILLAEEMLTDHELHPRVQPYNIHTIDLDRVIETRGLSRREIDTLLLANPGKIVVGEYSDDEEALLLQADEIINQHQKTKLITKPFNHIGEN